MSGRVVPQETRDLQRAASDPRLSAWVSANAGSGKTTVLTHRVIRLLLDGAAPSAILCLTFTKAAAANMQNRIFAILAAWASLDDEALAAALAEATGHRPLAEDLPRARRLFAEAVETPGGLKVLTIHAFCERVLHLFPFEANVPAEFAVLDERAAEELRDEARQAILVTANAAPESSIGRAMARIAEDTGAESFAGLLGEITERADRLWPLLRLVGPSEISLRVRRLLGLAPEETRDALDASIDSGGIAPAEWPRLAMALAETGEAKMGELSGYFADAAAGEGERRASAYRRVFTIKDGSARSPKGFPSRAFCAAHPGLAQLLQDELGRIEGLLERVKRAACAERTAAMLALAEAMLAHYARAKAGRAALDFDDLVGRTVQLLERAGAEWVLYKLDRGIDHLLVDEAQDTSPQQWAIVRRLAAEFTSGEGARGPLRRTIFAVGDEKQSIFSFQGAAPAEFAAMRRHFDRAFREASLDFRPIELKHSFRSTQDILGAVDAVFADAENRRGLSSDDVATVHATTRPTDPGRVEIWPVIVPEPALLIEAWDAPFDEAPAAAPPMRAAARLARAVKSLIEEGDAATGARFGPGDVMVLVRTRGPFFEAVIRALKRESVPVAGADRIVLMDHIVVLDLVALGRFALLPSDDLTLASLLKSPLIGLDDDDLMALAPGREGTLWRALGRAAETEPRYRAARDRLARWIDEAAFKTPFAFYADVLARDGGRRALLGRLGLEASDALDEFLGAAAEHERRATPSLEGFLAWIEGARTTIKRDMDVARGEVRVMTVHGAKGLEARVVVLADSCSAPDGRHDPKLFWIEDPHGAAGSLLPLWSPSAKADPPAVATARQAIREANEGEHRRLLYVAMTRAEERLIVSGHEGSRKRRAGTWYDMIRDALEPLSRLEPMPDGEGERLIFEPTPRRRVETRSDVEPAAAEAEPSWLRRLAPATPSHAVSLTPSGAEANGEAEVAPRLAGPGEAAERGRLVHRLLQTLPGLDAAERDEAARRFLLRQDADPMLADEVLALLADPAFGPVFAEGGRAEVPILGRLPAPDGGPPRLVSGRIDRLCIGAEEILIVDFKTHRTPPASLAEVPEAQVLQLALYRALLARLYPGRRVKAGLLFTAAPRLIEVPEAAMDEAVAGV